MFIDDYIEKISLKEELKNVKEQLKAVQDENAKLKTTIELYRKADAEKTEKIANLAAEVHRLNEELNSLKEDEDFGDNRINISDEYWLKYRLSIRYAINTTIDQLKNNSSTVSYSELLAMHTADVETINKLNIRARDLNGTISTLLERVSKSDEETHDLKKKVQQLKDIINDLNKKLYE